MGLPALRIEDLPHYSYDDYRQWEGRWEVIKGIPYAMTPSPTYDHQQISQNINLQLYELLKKCPLCRTILPMDWQITEDTVVQPDNMVICGDNTDKAKLTITPVLVFEILSPSTVNKDRVLKYQLYQQAGVRYYCMVDPKVRSVEVFVLNRDRYREVDFFEDVKMNFDLGSCSIAFDLSDIFD
ncbi:MAG: Uma2 family endonuclease [bacterium]|nr:Uma2 family endonuclease [bacterium]